MSGENMKSKRIYHRIYEVKLNDRTFHIDGQNHEYDSKEWQLFEVVPTYYGEENVWVETYCTKKAAMDDIPFMASQS